MCDPVEEDLSARVKRATADWVELTPYDFGWPGLFQEERRHLQSCLPGDLIRRIEHFGSTAVPGMTAKPIIDILVEVTDLVATKQRIVPLLVRQGYEYFWRPTYGDDGPPFYAWFIKRDDRTGVRTHHIHMVEHDFAVHWDRLLFRDYLARCPETAEEYARLKIRLAAEFGRDRIRYTQAKTPFIVAVTEQAKRDIGNVSPRPAR